MAQNVLFYSMNCQTCSTFLKLCHSNKLLQHFQLVCIDDKVKEYSNRGLNVVPTIIIKGYSKPIEGKEVFTWLNSVITMNSNKKFDNTNEQFLPTVGQTQNTNVIKRNTLNVAENNQNNTNIRQRNTENEQNTQSVPKVQVNQPFGFIQEEMSGFSDSFAYLMTDNPLPKSFLPCDKDLQIYTPPENNKLDKRNQEILIKNVETLRDNDKNEFVKNIENQHRQILYNK